MCVVRIRRRPPALFSSTYEKGDSALLASVSRCTVVHFPMLSLSVTGVHEPFLFSLHCIFLSDYRCLCSIGHRCRRREFRLEFVSAARSKRPDAAPATYELFRGLLDGYDLCATLEPASQSPTLIERLEFECLSPLTNSGLFAERTDLYSCTCFVRGVLPRPRRIASAKRVTANGV